MSDKRAHHARLNGQRGGRPPGTQDGPTSQRTLARAALRAKLLRTAELSADATLEQIRRCGFYDIRRLFDPAGNLRQLHLLTEAEVACIAGIEVVKRNLTSGDGQSDVILKVKLVDRSRYVEMAAKHHALLTDKVELSAEPELIAALHAGRKRAAEGTA